MNQKPETARKQGFTLIELSIVLVIIGLIVGGVLVGQDLIKAAEVRATVAQFEKYNAAMNTFRGKFGGLPGDLQQTQASAFGLFGFTAGTIGMGDGNGLIEASSAASGSTLGLGETLAVWRHLSDASLIDGAFGSIGSAAIDASTGAAANPSNISQALPPAKLGRGNYILSYAVSGKNYYEMGPVTALPANGQYTAPATGVTPQEAYNIDGKVDDGQPNTGNVQARGSAATGALNQAPNSNCALTTATTANYVRTSANPDCRLRLSYN